MVYPGSVMMVLTHYRKMHPYIFRHWVFMDLMNKLVIINISTVISKKRNVVALCLTFLIYKFPTRMDKQNPMINQKRR